MILLVRWDVPEESTVPVSQTLGEEKGTEKMKPNVKKLGYVFSDATSWLKRMSEHESTKLGLPCPSVMVPRGSSSSTSGKRRN